MDGKRERFDARGRQTYPLAVVNLYDIAYALGVGVSAPVWLLKGKARRKVLRAFRERMGRVPQREGEGPAVLIHAVSLGEVNATRGLVKRLRELRPGLQVVVSTTTDTGFARAREVYAAQADNAVSVIRFPLDFSGAVNRALDAVRPSAVVLMELEVWPNFMLQCERRGIPVILVNGRMTEPSFRRYRLGGAIVRKMFSRLAAVCVQDETYAERFEALGCAADRVRVTGTMKFDTAGVGDRVDGDEELAGEVGLPAPGQRAESGRVWVCGSTGPGEEEIVLGQYRSLLEKWPGLRLVIVPRHPERFDEVAGLIGKAGFAVVRRSATKGGPAGREAGNAVILGDTMGELRKFFSLADVVFVGRTLVDLGPRQHGSDMMEPAGLGKAVIVGRYTGNFAEVMERFRAAGAMVEVGGAEELGEAVGKLLGDPAAAREMGRRAQEVVLRGKGATERNVEVVMKHVGGRSNE